MAASPDAFPEQESVGGALGVRRAQESGAASENDSRAQESEAEGDGHQELATATAWAFPLRLVDQDELLVPENAKEASDSVDRSELAELQAARPWWWVAQGAGREAGPAIGSSPYLDQVRGVSEKFHA